MSKQVKNWITEELTKRLEGIEAVGVLNPRGINATKNNLIRRRLHEKGRKKTDDTIELRGIFFDGEIYPGQSGVETVSKMPTREEAIGQLAALVLAPGRKLGADLKGPGGRLGGILKAIEEKQKSV